MQLLNIVRSSCSLFLYVQMFFCSSFPFEYTLWYGQAADHVDQQTATSCLLFNLILLLYRKQGIPRVLLCFINLFTHSLALLKSVTYLPRATRPIIRVYRIDKTQEDSERMPCIEFTIIIVVDRKSTFHAIPTSLVHFVLILKFVLALSHFNNFRYFLRDRPQILLFTSSLLFPFQLQSAPGEEIIKVNRILAHSQHKLIT